MRTVISAVVAGLVLYLASVLFPEVVIVEGFGNLLLATILVCAITLAVMLIGAIVLAFFMLISQSITITILGFLALFLSGIAGVWLADAILPGFNVVGAWPKILLALCMTAPTISFKTED